MDTDQLDDLHAFALQQLGEVEDRREELSRLRFAIRRVQAGLPSPTPTQLLEFAESLGYTPATADQSHIHNIMQ